jgi:hypothetical protein
MGRATALLAPAANVDPIDDGYAFIHTSSAGFATAAAPCGTVLYSDADCCPSALSFGDGYRYR